MASSGCEHTLVILKPDAVKRGLIGCILQRFEQRGFKIAAAKLMVATDELLEKHYHEHTSKSFYPGLARFMKSGPVMALVLQGTSVVSVTRAMMGQTNPATSAPGTIRGDFAIETDSNVIHGSDSLKSAEYEIGLWFPELKKPETPHDFL
ncbi:nucleoside diphosphate kinase [Mitosporidium daphniae]|uniref:Nucleoside diphosphate kinase n=1 Tax=Mitosporidium daphniae TaxID=1485682 RepID=A0A098VSN6_9MICR|nr:nucleoside diphosphate kinase [Mitosporidium daphniae]KGG52103.1 nucleoside diphosphate kinase [Mitosporidium daphniae]|eukprot:XP_013238530.1 nucleoside diphosphate kinase [Mitosporidium daphniae]